jgi:hypothetical protein
MKMNPIDIILSFLASLVSLSVLVSLCGALGAASLAGEDFASVGIIAHLCSVFITQTIQVIFSDVGIAVTGPDILPNIIMAGISTYVLDETDDALGMLPTLLLVQGLTSFFAGCILLTTAYFGLPQRFVDKLVTSSNKIFSSIIGFFGLLVIRKGFSVASSHIWSVLLAIPFGLMLLIHKYQGKQLGMVFSTSSNSPLTTATSSSIPNESPPTSITEKASGDISTSSSTSGATITSSSNNPDQNKLKLVLYIFTPLAVFFIIRWIISFLFSTTPEPTTISATIITNIIHDPWVFQQPSTSTTTNEILPPNNNNNNNHLTTLLPMPFILWNHFQHIPFIVIAKSLPFILFASVIVTSDVIFKQAAIFVGLGLKELRFNRETIMTGCSLLICGFCSCPPTYAQLKLALLQNSIVQNHDNRLAGILLSLSLMGVLIGKIVWQISFIEKLPRFFVSGILIFVGGDLLLENTVIKMKNLSVSERRMHGFLLCSMFLLMIMVEIAIA